MIKAKELELSKAEKDLLFDTLVDQQYAIELLGSQITDIETGRKHVDEDRLKQLQALYDRLVKAGL